MSPDEFVARLSGVRPRGNGQWMARCPAHEDRTASLSVKATSDGRTLIHCFAGCSTDDICGAIGAEVRDLMGERPDYRGHDRERWHLSAGDALRILGVEITVAAIVAADVAEHREVSEDTWHRLALAVGRINEVRRAVRD